MRMMGKSQHRLRCRLRHFLRQLDNSARERTVSEFKGHVRQFVLYDGESGVWYMDGRECANRAIMSSLGKSGFVGDGLVGEWIGYQPLLPFFWQSRCQRELVSSSDECVCDIEGMERLDVGYMEAVSGFCHGGYGDVGYQCLYIYEEVFRLVGSSLEEVCEKEIGR